VSSVIGGLGNLWGTIFGAYFLALVENLAVWVLPSGYKEAVTFCLLFLFLLYNPKGIFGLGSDLND
ncbi:hypothetical protein GF327_01330, partial [Candidatus Woesearchaeota archaeon]|nr:hypothetical protein [Candidatus Woesearchaeota archaeon]